MGSIKQTLDTAFRDFEVAGDPSSGIYEPEKAYIRALGPLLEFAIARAGLGALVSDAKASAAQLSLAAKDKAVALVFADDSDGNNDLWIKTGAPGVGAWENTGALQGIMGGLGGPYLDGAEQSATAAGQYAEAAEGAQASASASEFAAMLAAQAAANAYTGPLTPGTWKRFRQWPRLLLTGVGSAVFDARDLAGTITESVAAYTLTGGDIVQYPFFGADAIEARATLTGTATAEIF